MVVMAEKQHGAGRSAGIFLAGLAAGAALVMAGQTAAENENGGGLAGSVLYAISELSVETEVNAGKIEELDERVANLEAEVRRLASAKPAD